MDDSCFVEGDGGRKILRTRAGLGSGLELVLPGNLWTNLPVVLQKDPERCYQTSNDIRTRS